MSYKLTIEDQGTCCVFSGSFTSNDLKNSNNEIAKLPHFPELKYQLLNFHSVTEFPVDSNAIRAVAKQDFGLYKINEKIKVAIVANKLVVKGLAQMYKTYFELEGNDIVWGIETFETNDEARKWIIT